MLFTAATGGAGGGQWRVDAAERWRPLVLEDVLRSCDIGGCNYGVGGTVNGRSPLLTHLPAARQWIPRPAGATRCTGWTARAPFARGTKGIEDTGRASTPAWTRLIDAAARMRPVLGTFRTKLVRRVDSALRRGGGGVPQVD